MVDSASGPTRSVSWGHNGIELHAIITVHVNEIKVVKSVYTYTRNVDEKRQYRHAHCRMFSLLSDIYDRQIAVPEPSLVIA